MMNMKIFVRWKVYLKKHPFAKIQIKWLWEFSGGPVAKTPHPNAGGGQGSNSDQRTRSYMLQLRPRTAK